LIDPFYPVAANFRIINRNGSIDLSFLHPPTGEDAGERLRGGGPGPVIRPPTSSAWSPLCHEGSASSARHLAHITELCIFLVAGRLAC
jgi:hypothetical protein